LHDSISAELSLDLDRIDIRKDKGMVKFVFTEHFWEIQLDGATGTLLQIERRRSDFIENIHDGSILDFYFGTTGGQIKLVYTSTMGLALLIFTVTGFWLWYGPKRIRKNTTVKYLKVIDKRLNLPIPCCFWYRLQQIATMEYQETRNKFSVKRKRAWKKQNLRLPKWTVLQRKI
jgi:hypothetical protein